MLERELTDYLRDLLPPYMVPAAIVELDEFPQTPNHKVDTRALPPPISSFDSDASGPEDEVEEWLCAVWSELLSRDRVHPDDDLFRIGGHSLIALRIIARVREHYGVDVDIDVLFDKPTVADLAEVIRRGGGE